MFIYAIVAWRPDPTATPEEKQIPEKSTMSNWNLSWVLILWGVLYTLSLERTGWMQLRRTVKANNVARSLTIWITNELDVKIKAMFGVYLQRSWVVLSLSSILMLPVFVFAMPLLKLVGHPVVVAERAWLVAVWLIPFHLSFPFQFTLQRFLQCQLKIDIAAWVSGARWAFWSC